MSLVLYYIYRERERERYTVKKENDTTINYLNFTKKKNTNKQPQLLYL